MESTKVLDLSSYNKYAGKVIARDGRSVIEFADTVEELVRKLKEKGIDPRFVVIDYIPEEPIYYMI